MITRADRNGKVRAVVWIARKRWGSAVLGIIVCTMIYTIMFMVFEPSLIYEKGVLAPLWRGLFGGVATGIAAGLYLWEPPVDTQAPGSTDEPVKVAREP